MWARKKIKTTKVTTEKGKVRRNSVRERGRAPHAWAAPWDQLAHITATLAEASHPLNGSATVFNTHRPNFSLYVPLHFSPATCQWETKWMNERQRLKKKSHAQGQLQNSWGESERKWGAESCRQGRKRNLNGPILLLKPHREITWGQAYSLFVCLNGEGPPVCALLYKLKRVQLASPAMDFLIRSVRKLSCGKVRTGVVNWKFSSRFPDRNFSVRIDIPHMHETFSYSIVPFNSHQIR